jgi:hypothetical protein
VTEPPPWKHRTPEDTVLAKTISAGPGTWTEKQDKFVDAGLSLRGLSKEAAENKPARKYLQGMWDDLTRNSRNSPDPVKSGAQSLVPVQDDSPPPDAYRSIQEERIRYDAMKLLAGRRTLSDWLSVLSKAEADVMERRRTARSVESQDEREKLLQQIADDEVLIAQKRRDLSAEYGIPL